MSNDSHLDRMAINEAKDQQAQLPETEEISTGMFVLDVRNDTPTLGVARCERLSANNPWSLLLPRNPRRRSAMVLAVDNDVYLCSSQALAQSVAGSAAATDGFYLPKGIVVPVTYQAPVWVACTTTGSSSRVSVLVSEDDE